MNYKTDNKPREYGINSPHTTLRTTNLPPRPVLGPMPHPTPTPSRFGYSASYRTGNSVEDYRKSNSNYSSPLTSLPYGDPASEGRSAIDSNPIPANEFFKIGARS